MSSNILYINKYAFICSFLRATLIQILAIYYFKLKPNNLCLVAILKYKIVHAKLQTISLFSYA